MSLQNPNSHTTTRRLTKSWEFADRKLYGYDFTDDYFFEKSSKSLLVGDKSFGSDIEKYLNDFIENPLAHYLSSVGSGILVNSIPWKQERALRLSIIMQGARNSAGNGDQKSIDFFKYLLSNGESVLDQMAVGTANQFRFFGGKINADQLLYFPSAGIAGFSIVGANKVYPGVIFQPTSPNTFIIAVPSIIPHNVADKQIYQSVANNMIVANSVGLTCERVIIPPSLRKIDKEKIRENILSLRENCKKINDMITKINNDYGW